MSATDHWLSSAVARLHLARATLCTFHLFAFLVFRGGGGRGSFNNMCCALPPHSLLRSIVTLSCCIKHEHQPGKASLAYFRTERWRVCSHPEDPLSHEPEPCLGRPQAGDAHQPLFCECALLRKVGGAGGHELGRVRERSESYVGHPRGNPPHDALIPFLMMVGKGQCILTTRMHHQLSIRMRVL